MPACPREPQALASGKGRGYNRGLQVRCRFRSSVAPSEAAATEFTSAQRKFWSFKPVVRPAAPSAEGSEWVRNPIDAFILGGLRSEGLEPSAPADRITLIRRASFGLLGLPPTPDQVADFLADDSPDAVERLVDRLLASPGYGERWGRHWLDLARFAESDGFEQDGARPYAWRYRDYVIDSFNTDKPYDRFVREQIAGDELWPESFEARIATGFSRHYPEEGNQKDLLLARQETLHDITTVVGATFMGLTFGCAQCHDHKFDPITQKDYYRLQAFFANVNHDDRFPVARADELAEYERALAVWKEKTAAIWAEMSDILMPYRTYTPAQLLARYPDYVIDAIERPTSERTALEAWMASLLSTKDCGTCPLRPEPYVDPSFLRVVGKLHGDDKTRFEELQSQLEAFSSLRPDEIDRASGMIDVSADAPPTHVLANGRYTSPGQEVQPGFPAVLKAGEVVIVPPEGGGSTGRRSALANWLARPSNPLTARVMSNRVWHHHFGRGIAGTPSDFGMMGERPTHPELLDWLASELVDGGWSIKRLHRAIMVSSTYRQSAAPHSYERAARSDPFNRLLWRFDSKRHEAEVIRDSALSAAGLLNRLAGGPSVFPPLPEGLPEPVGGWKAHDASSAHRRRSVYVSVRRNTPFPLLDAFDFPDTHESCARRNRTTTAPQALALLNGEEPAEWARAFAGRVLAISGASARKQVDAAYRIAYSRSPEPLEADTAATFLDRQSRIIAERIEQDRDPAVPDTLPSGVVDEQAASLVDLSLMLLNSNEFAYSF